MKSVNSDRAYEHLRKRILSGEYPPGAPLVTEQLALEIGMSRTPIRDALRQLETDGLVTIQARLGARVRSMSSTEFRDMCNMRLALETHAADLAAQFRTETELQELNFTLESMRQLTGRILSARKDEPLLAELVRLDVQFHIGIMTAAKCELMKREILRLHLINRVVGGIPQAASDKAERDNERRRTLAGHTKIFEAIKAGDRTSAKAAMADHIQDILDTNVRLLSEAEARNRGRKLTEEVLSYSA